MVGVGALEEQQQRQQQQACRSASATRTGPVLLRAAWRGGCRSLVGLGCPSGWVVASARARFMTWRGGETSQLRDRCIPHHIIHVCPRPLALADLVSTEGTRAQWRCGHGDALAGLGSPYNITPPLTGCLLRKADRPSTSAHRTHPPRYPAERGLGRVLGAATQRSVIHTFAAQKPTGDVDTAHGAALITLPAHPSHPIVSPAVSTLHRVQITSSTAASVVTRTAVNSSQ